jgi:hypothetical protein
MKSAELQRLISDYSGGSETRYRHALNRNLIYSEGMLAVANQAGSHWLIDDIAILCEPSFRKAWLDGETGIGIVFLDVFTSEQRAELADRPAARMQLSLADDTPVAYSQDLTATDFPEGRWTFYLGMDQLDENAYVTVLYLPSEH